MNRITKDVLERASKIRLLLMDVDGLFTDGKFYFLPGPDGKIIETKAFDSQDGIALQEILQDFEIGSEHDRRSQYQNADRGRSPKAEVVGRNSGIEHS